MDGLVGEAGQGRLDVVPLAQLEVLAEVLITAPPVQVDHVQTLVTTSLMEVGVTNVVLDAVSGEPAIASGRTMSLGALTDSPAPVVDHALLLVLDEQVEHEGAPHVQTGEEPENTDAVLSVERVHLPVNVAKWVLVEAGDILERSPSLGLVTRLLRLVNELAEVAVGVLSKSSAQKS